MTVFGYDVKRYCSGSYGVQLVMSKDSEDGNSFDRWYIYLETIGM